MIFIWSIFVSYIVFLKSNEKSVLLLLEMIETMPDFDVAKKYEYFEKSSVSLENSISFVVIEIEEE